MIEDSRATWMRAVGRYLDRQCLRNAFIAVGADTVTVTPVSGRNPLFSVMFSRDELASLARGGSPGLSGGPGQEALLEQAGAGLDERGCHTGFVVVYGDTLIIDYGDGEEIRLLTSCQSPVASCQSSVAGVVSDT